MSNYHRIWTKNFNWNFSFSHFSMHFRVLWRANVNTPITDSSIKTFYRGIYPISSFVGDENQIKMIINLSILRKLSHVVMLIVWTIVWYITSKTKLIIDVITSYNAMDEIMILTHSHTQNLEMLLHLQRLCLFFNGGWAVVEILD